MAATPKIPTPANVSVGPEMMPGGGTPFAYKKPDIAKLNPVEVAKTAKVIGRKTEADPPEDVNKALEESAKLFLELKDAHVALIALARQVENTPMGQELRYDVLDMLRHMKADKIPEKQQAVFKSMQDQMGKLNLPDKPPTKAFETFLLANKDKFPPDVNPERLALMFNSGEMTPGKIMDLFNKYKEFQDLREPLAKELLGNKPPLTTPEALLDAVHIEKSDQNLKALKEAFKREKVIKPHGGFDKTLAIGLFFMIASTGIQMFQQDSQPPQRGGAHG